ncbi:hypothetical protein JG687_00017854 [Phytophthora cactorum]|uniref:Uncharacterized protein n=1 Tax=Phytophthora cactorum TaxID=29920 RepID=A0A8T1TM95_9STRA|nr:hypothetical protein JG687_00017854 [Phytophthora cactorum]
MTTVTSRHRVNGKGIVTVLNKLELLEKALKTPKSLDPVGRQANDPVGTQANSNNVDYISNIGTVETNQLKAINVRAVRDHVHRAVDAPSTQQWGFFGPEVLAQYATIPQNFDERQISIETKLTSIPQYVWRCMSKV